MNKKAARRAEVEAKILRLLNAEPMSNADLALYLGVTRQAASFYTKGMHKRRVIHVQGFRLPTIAGNAHMLFGVGDKPDFVRILRNNRVQTPIEVTLQRKRDILDSLKTPKSAKEIANKINLGGASVLKYLQFLRKTGKVRIDGYKSRGNANQWVPQYGLGSEPDAPLPPPSSKSSRARDGSRALGDDFMASSRSRATVENTIAAARARPHNPFSALGL